ncbi:hypothetical protein ILUMI_02082 [Ignelater luminosus]|uniref:Peptidase S1 domain-containing protein n=1 Tax=Ignelater luminosus TaxID=2038154 RepID=A0A8K0DID5_IGNLU|nr:hypothetical protein ILUMI_02082 [Ignelater luminosus]
MSYKSVLGTTILILKAVSAFLPFDHDPKVTGGDVASIHKYPYVVSMLEPTEEGGYYASPGTRYKLHCMGTVIARWTVLTSAACIKKLEKVFVRGDVTVRGNTETWKCNCHRTRDHSVSKYFRHKNYKKRKVSGMTIPENDIGIINVIEEFVGIFETIFPYQSGSDYWQNTPEYYATAIGWGPRLPSNRTESEILISSDLFILRNKNCRDEYK